MTADRDNLAPSWRQLPFYETQKVRGIDDFARPPSIFGNPVEIAAVTVFPDRPAFVEDGVDTKSSQEKAIQVSPYSIVADTHGRIHVCESDQFSILGTFTAFADKGIVKRQASSSQSKPEQKGSGRVTHISCDDRGRLITLGEDDNTKFPLLRIWDLGSSVQSSFGSSSPRLLAEAKVQHGSKPNPVSTKGRSLYKLMREY